MDKQARIDRISRMEKHLNQVICMQDDLGRALKAYTEAREALEELKDYMDSGAWKEDYEADEAGRLPADLPRGVLSQDGLYNLLQDTDEVIARAKALFAGK